MGFTLAHVREVAGILCVAICLETNRHLRIAFNATDIYVRYAYNANTRIGLPWATCKSHYESHIFLTTMSCLQIASKVMGYENYFTGREVKAILLRHDQNYDLLSIRESEFLVFKGIDLSAPFLGKFELTELLIASTTIPTFMSIQSATDNCLALFRLIYTNNRQFYRKLAEKYGIAVLDPDEGFYLNGLLPYAVLATSCRIALGEHFCIIDQLIKFTTHNYINVKVISDLIYDLLFNR